MKNKIRALYHAPFTVDHDYVYDARKEIVADFRGNNDSLRPRGWDACNTWKMLPLCMIIAKVF